MLAVQPALDGLPTPPSTMTPPRAVRSTTASTPSTASTATPPPLTDAVGPPRNPDVHIHLRGNPAQFDLDILRVVLSSVNAAYTLLSSRPEGNVRPIFTSGHRHYARLALMADLISYSRDYLNDDEVELLIWAQRSVAYEAALRHERTPLPSPNSKGIARLRALLRHLQTSVDTLAVNAAMRRTSAIRRGGAEQFGEETVAQFPSPLALH